ncbi:hypothetical protein PTSG_04262 [Salpingoeca rosetta]|uniref:Pre-rRNA-processing protein Ipi1 N-terminal domain-containing protein n=1 Tax=Salpingoeca rosetta (strain ATCC 50818 / BSB-021) TaxID=946362 RepID=F2U725_SALR5|nr:uncharacterized protein PTSG_04262 [Salpingoeca rosetta]EGD83657.1 hypothetical protein PTSG_04262 [Salpingoeca rosetta]|eukprot:XP_004995161.1 hypothetical protein PTSG_04262 [Salpingoeca rosetta]
MVRTRKKAGKSSKEVDFKKKKNKVGKSKRQENATVTTFKTRAIHVTSSLREVDHAKEIVTQQGQTISDLLAKAGHYNKNVRADAVHAMALLIEDHPELLQQAAILLAVVERVCPLISDLSHRVRTEVAALLKIIASSCDQTQLVPYFPLMVAHTSTAMTSIDHYTREDALNVIDVWIDHLPALLGEMGHKLLDNFLHLISSQSSGGSGGGSSSGGLSSSLASSSAIGSMPGGRQLSGAPSSALSSNKGRKSVLQRLNRFTQIALRTHVPEVNALHSEAQALPPLQLGQACVNTVGLYPASGRQWQRRQRSETAPAPASFSTVPAATAAGQQASATTTATRESAAAVHGSASSAAGSQQAGQGLMSPSHVLLYAVQDLWPVLDQAWLELVSTRDAVGVTSESDANTLSIVSILVDLAVCIVQFLQAGGHSGVTAQTKEQQQQQQQQQEEEEEAMRHKHTAPGPARKRAKHQQLHRHHLTCLDLIPTLSSLFFERFPFGGDACFHGGNNGLVLLWLNARTARMMAISWLWMHQHTASDDTTTTSSSSSSDGSGGSGSRKRGKRGKAAKKGGDTNREFEFGGELTKFLHDAVSSAKQMQHEAVLQHVLQTVVLLSTNCLLGAEVLDAVAKLHAAVPLDSSHKRLTFHVMAEMLRWTASLSSSKPDDEALKAICMEWAKTLPRLAWQLNVSNTSFSHDALATIHFVIAHKLLSEKDAAATARQLARLVITTAKGKDFAGPFQKLPARTQHLLLDVLSLTADSAAMHDTALVAARAATLLRVDATVHRRLVKLAISGRHTATPFALAAARVFLDLEAGVDVAAACEDVVLDGQPRVCAPLLLTIAQGRVKAKAAESPKAVHASVAQAVATAQLMSRLWCEARHKETPPIPHIIAQLSAAKDAAVPVDRACGLVALATALSRIESRFDASKAPLPPAIVDCMAAVLCFHARHGLPEDRPATAVANANTAAAATAALQTLTTLLDMAVAVCNGDAAVLAQLLSGVAARMDAVGASKMLPLLASLCKDERVLDLLRQEEEEGAVVDAAARAASSLYTLLATIATTHERLSAQVRRVRQQLEQEGVAEPTP